MELAKCDCPPLLHLIRLRLVDMSCIAKNITSANLKIHMPVADASRELSVTLCTRLFIRASRRVGDMSLSKSWKLTERIRLQLRGEMFNVLNHASFDVFTMNTDLSVPSTVGTVDCTPDVAAANPVIGSGGSRHIQIAAKFLW